MTTGSSILLYKDSLNKLGELVKGVSPEISARNISKLDVRALVCRSIWELAEDETVKAMVGCKMKRDKKAVRYNSRQMSTIRAVNPILSVSNAINIILMNIHNMPDVVEELKTMAQAEVMNYRREE